MNNINIDPNTVIFDKGKEIFLKNKGNKAILLIHGFTGIPYEMKYLADNIYINTNYTIYVPRLPGHGTNTQDFRESSANDWLRKSYDSYLKLKSEYDNVSVIGLSMGGLISLLIAAKFEIEKLITISPALNTYNPFDKLTPILKYFIPKIKQKTGLERIKNSEDKEEEFYHRNYHLYHYTSQIAELVKVMKLTKKNLANVTVPTLILASEADKLVPISAAQKIKRKISSVYKEIFIFEKAKYVICNSEKKEKCIKKTLEFLSERTPQ
ncbi:MAG: alpha/beta hydrolase [Bacillota bacterium]